MNSSEREKYVLLFIGALVIALAIAFVFKIEFLTNFAGGLITGIIVGVITFLQSKFKKEAHAHKESKFKDWHKLAIAFVISYIVLYAAQALLSGSGIISAWGKNPTFYIYAIIGFFFMYFAIDWVSKRMELDFVKKPWFLALFLIAGVLAWHFALVFYTQNNVILELKGNEAYQQGGELTFTESCKLNAVSAGAKRNDTIDSFAVSNCMVAGSLIDQLKTSTYFIFLLSAILGWISHWIIKEKS